MNIDLPKISIVTPSFNQSQFIEETILSIINQEYPNTEYIIMDGGSTDGSVEIIRKYEKHLNFWVSEKDKGQTDAINRGLSIASGSYVNWINSDDLLEKGALWLIAEAIKANPDKDIFYGDYRAIDSESKTIYKRNIAPYSYRNLYWGRQLSSQPSVFFRKNLLKEVGHLDIRKHFCMDTEFWIRCARSGKSFCQIKGPIGITRAHGDAKTTRLQHILYEEHKDVVRSYGSLNLFRNSPSIEDFFYKFQNRFWRYHSAFKRLLFRGDFSFFQASKAVWSFGKGQK